MKLFTQSIFFISALAILLYLGFWQTKRLEWKNNIIDQLNDEYTKNFEEWVYEFEDLKSDKILYGSVRGHFIYTKEILVGPKPLNGKIGYAVITPMKLKDGKFILVNRGWINQTKINQISQTHSQRNLLVSGVFREPEWNYFTPNNSPENNVWTKLDIGQIAKAKNIHEISPLILYKEKSSKKNDLLLTQEKKWLPRNKHRQYAIFWFSMAGILLCVSGLYWKKTDLVK